MRESQACVIIAVRLEDDHLGTEADDRFVEAIEHSIRDRLEVAPELGRWDGHEFGGGWATIFCNGKEGALLSDCVLGAILPFHSTRQLCVTNDKPCGPEDFMLLLTRATAAPSTH
jgi:hypothetical protein